MTTPTPRFASALSTHADLSIALREVAERVSKQLGQPANLAFVFVSADRAEQMQQVATHLCDALATHNLLGCTAESLLETEREIEGETAISLWAAVLPEVQVEPMHLRYERAAEGAFITGWTDACDGPWPEHASLFCLGEPFSFPADAMLERLNDDRPGTPVFGGMASGGSVPGENRLIVGREVHRDGAVAALVSGAIRVRSVLSQGCRPIGKPLVITKAEGNVILELGGRAALVQLKEIFDELPTHEQQLVQRGLHVGRVVSEYLERFESGDFLVRNVMGIDAQRGAIAVGDYFRTGQTVQFHIRDVRTADDDLKQCFRASQQAGAAPLAALMFTCNGRGIHLFREPSHDVECLKATFGDLPLAGFFAQGELGPIGGKNFMHGFTASVALFEQS